jgi:hypothetical protein
VLLPEICKIISFGKFLKHELALFEDIVANPEATLLRTTGQAAKMFQQKKTRRGKGARMSRQSGSSQTSVAGSAADIMKPEAKKSDEDERGLQVVSWADQSAPLSVKGVRALSEPSNPPSEEKSPSPAVSARCLSLCEPNFHYHEFRYSLITYIEIIPNFG